MKKILGIIFAIIITTLLITMIVLGAFIAYDMITKNNDNTKAVAQQTQEDIGKNNSNSDDQSSSSQNENNNEQTSIDSNEASTNNKSTQVEVNRNNVFDYLFAAMDHNGYEKDMYKYKEPVFNSTTGNWEILASNKGGAGGGLTFKVEPDGAVLVYDNLNRFDKKIK
ncbi:hypothetical protein J3T65_02900 [Staphylococcus simiae]|uniref:DUF4834 family protein n=1 Tax=Staphylococcus simiae TaxID=308354 RepID=UPI001A96445D|nr:DUF4834 family protein [Staphylococcus simiae]MBO1198414.1 hypothetical protein [Staphylococcus simiae]MBO1200608.1 hypothetical protein [Staphylococcus simiae]MBO1202879.1 hypothetical protein [Staphylococcus simiae]MBO1210405.1 hypothetical protein [Staphylococcus simiae]MBO1228945.1 hypothetical protein [Staphylococcus simiae]